MQPMLSVQERCTALLRSTAQHSHSAHSPGPPVARVLAAATTGSVTPAGSAAARSAATVCRLPAVLEASCSSSLGSATARTAEPQRRCWRRRRGGSRGAVAACRPSVAPSCRC